VARGCLITLRLLSAHDVCTGALALIIIKTLIEERLHSEFDERYKQQENGAQFRQINMDFRSSTFITLRGVLVQLWESLPSQHSISITGYIEDRVHIPVLSAFELHYHCRHWYQVRTVQNYTVDVVVCLFGSERGFPADPRPKCASPRVRVQCTGAISATDGPPHIVRQPSTLSAPTSMYLCVRV